MFYTDNVTTAQELGIPMIPTVQYHSSYRTYHTFSQSCNLYVQRMMIHCNGNFKRSEIELSISTNNCMIQRFAGDVSQYRLSTNKASLPTSEKSAKERGKHNAQKTVCLPGWPARPTDDGNGNIAA
eukprot:scaffold144133_cov50-Attheya_sp.AAC.1